MIGVVLLLCAFAAGAFTLRWFVAVPDQQAVAGWFGEPERERVVLARTATTIALAEAYVRLSGLASALRTEAWRGVPFTIRRLSATWAEWAFADGRVWIVRHGGHCPKRARRMIVSAATPTARGLLVDAYGSRAGHPATQLLLEDARDAGEVDGLATP